MATSGDIMFRFQSDRRGVSAVIFALAAVPLIVGAALAIDVAGVTAATIKLESAADAGLLAGVTTAASAGLAGTDWATIVKNSQDAAKARSIAQAGQIISV